MGTIRDASGNPLAGVTVKVGIAVGDWSALSRPSDANGAWDMLLGAGYARAGRWYAVVIAADTGAQLSPRFEFTTSDNCTPGQGIQTYQVDFQRGGSTTGGTVPPTPVPAPPSSGYPYGAGVVKRTFPNCGLTNVIGNIRAANGAALSGVSVKVGTASMDWSAISRPSDANGYWDMLLGVGYARAGSWYAMVIDPNTGAQLSPRFDFTTSSNCTPGQGVQTYDIEFKRNS